MLLDKRFDGDTASATSVISDDAVKELDDYMSTREAWVTPTKTMRATISYDTSQMIFLNLTSSFDHVEKLDRKGISNLERYI